MLKNYIDIKEIITEYKEHFNYDISQDDIKDIIIIIQGMITKTIIQIKI